MPDLIQLTRKDFDVANYQPEIKQNGSKLDKDAALYYRQVATNMRKARRELKLSQQKIADAMCIPRSTYRNLESGKVGIYCYHMAKWSYVTGYDVRVLTKGTSYDLTLRSNGHALVNLIEKLPQKQYDAVVGLMDAF